MDTAGDRRWLPLPIRLEVHYGGYSLPAIQTRFSHSCIAIRQGPVQRQKAQIVQSPLTLDDFLPLFKPLTVR